jgi:hypothetical protein
MTLRTLRHGGSIAMLALATAVASSARADLSPEELAKLSQNPIGNIINVPFQENANLNDGTGKKTRNVVNIQPVIPIEIDKDWNLLTRTILPLISQPEPDGGRTNGVGDTQFELWPNAGKPREVHLGLWAFRAGPDPQQRSARKRSLGAGTHSRHCPRRQRQPVGLWGGRV